jgi:5,10-methenyltetrahydromethanopterin hydrogenase
LGITTFRRASIITRKQANALAAVTARVLAVRVPTETKAFLVQNIILLLPVLHKPRQFQDLTDNELDEVLNAKTSFNKKSYNRPTKYSR